MKTIKTDDPAVLDAVRNLKSANAMFGEAKKKSEASKEMLSRWLKEHRGIEIESLDIGDMVQIEGVLLIEISKQNKFDEAAFSLDHPQLHADYHRDKAIRKFKPLIESTSKTGRRRSAIAAIPATRDRIGVVKE